MYAPSRARRAGQPRAPRRPNAYVEGVLALTLLAAAVRFSTLSVQSYWLDESITVGLVRAPFGDMISAIPHSESTPYLYYVLAWLWSHVFGTGEAGLRSLSALFGTATVPVAYGAVARLVSRRAGIVAAALAAVNPLLVWYSQEARAYSLLVLLAAVSLLLWARALERPGNSVLAGWALASVAALATHYFALFVVAPEALWLLWRRRRPPELVAIGAVAAAGAALLPLAIDQAANKAADFISHTSLLKRVVQVPKQYLVGFDAPNETLVSAAALVLAAYGLWLLAARANPDERRGAGLAAGVAAPALLIPLGLALAGADYFITRNLIAAWLPSAAVLAAGLGARRAGRAGALATALLCALSLIVTISVEADPAYQRSDWRGLARALGPPAQPRALVISPVAGARAFGPYLARVDPFPAPGYPVSEIDAVAVTRRAAGQKPAPPRPAAPAAPPPGFALVGQRRTATYTIVRYRAAQPVPVAPPALAPLQLTPGPADLAIELPRPPAGPARR